MMLTALEWAAFGGVLLATWLYGSTKRAGPIVGFFSALAFIEYGFLTDTPAAWMSNIAFAAIHARNYWVATR